MSLLEALGIKHYMGDRLLLDIERVEIHQKERIGLVGKNGSGKSTLLNVLAGKLRPDQGTMKSQVQIELLPQLKRQDAVKSGGEITQEYITKSIGKEAGILLADEPTTHLDKEHIEWLEKKLSHWQGAFVIVSHDRAFLDALCTTIWELDEGQIHEYTGNYSAYAAQKEMEIEQKRAAYEQYEAKKRQLIDAVKLKEKKAERATKKPKNVSSSEARITGTKPYFAKKQKKMQKTAKALETRLEKLEKVEKVKEATPLKMSLPHEESFKGRVILRAEKLMGGFGKRVLWRETSFQVSGGDKLAVIGPNGSGKTTLLKHIISGGTGVQLSPSVKFGYFSQNLNVLDTERTILENVSINSIQSETVIRTVLARLGFFSEDVHKPVGVLSGGERVKTALAKIFVSDCNTLILDEPTNFLDIDAAAELESLLQEYEGTVLFVSHDRRFIEHVATKILAIDQQTLKLFDGTYPQFLEASRQQSRSTVEDDRLLIETKITEVLSRLSIEPTEELEAEFQRLLKQKRELG